MFPFLVISVLCTSIKLAISMRYFADYDNPIYRERYSQFNCYKFRTCTRGAPRVCGYNPHTQHMDEFEDRCAIYQINCREQEFYKPIDMSRCIAKKAFLAAHNESLQFEHVFWPNKKRTTTNPSPISTIESSTEATTISDHVHGLVRLINIQ